MTGSQAAPRALGLLLAAFLAGAGGMAIEVLSLSTAGLALGYGRPAALGLAVWIAAWACGAFASGRARGALPRRLLATGLLAAAAGLAAVEGALLAGRAPLAVGLAGALALGAIALAAFFQGAFLPALASGLALSSARLGVAALFVANLAGSVLGARALGHEVAAAWGRLPAAGAGAAASLLAGLIGAACAPSLARRAAVPAEPGSATSPETAGRPAAGRRAAVLAVGFLTAHLVSRWIGLRTSLLWLGGMQASLTAILVASLVALSLGAALLPPLLPRDARGPLILVSTIAIASLWPFAAPWAIGRLAHLASPDLRALVLVGPMLLPFGAVVPVLHRSLGQRGGESGERLGGLLLAEAWGALAGILVAHFVAVPRWGLPGGIAVSLAWCALALLTLRRGAPRLAGLGMVSTLAAGGFALTSPSPVLASPALSNPAFRRLAFQEDEHFAVTVVEDGVRDERTLLTDDFRATAVGDDYLYMQVLGHLPLLLHPEPERVCVLAFGTGTTAGAVSLHPIVSRLEVLEISRAVCRAAPFFEEVNHGVLADGVPALLEEREDARVALRLGDGRRTLRAAPGRYDVITMEPLLPSSPFAVYLYTEEFYVTARRALAPGGLLCQWVPPHAVPPDVFDSLLAAFTRSFPWSGVFLFGTQVVLVGGERTPELAPERFRARTPALSSALGSLGLDEPAGCASRLVTTGADWPAVPRRLRDADPWIVYRASGSGAQRLADLPRNLARLRAHESPLPAAWVEVVGQAGVRRLEAVRLLHRAREARAWQRAARLGVGADSALGAGLASLADYRAALQEALPDDPERLQLERALAFDAAREAGILALSRGEARSARKPLLDAIDLRPRNADLYLFLALALQRSGDSEHAAAAAARALELCPRVLETPQGLAARRLGLELIPGVPAPDPGRPDGARPAAGK